MFSGHSNMHGSYVWEGGGGGGGGRLVTLCNLKFLSPDSNNGQ